MFLSPNNTDYDYLCIDNVQLTQDTASNGTIFILPRGVYFKDLVINNSTLHKTNIHSSNYSINSNSVIIKDSTLYVTTSYGRVFGDFGQTLKELDISTSTFIPINYDGLFKSSYNNVDYVELGNLVSDDTYQFTNTQRGFQSSDTKVIKFNEFDTRYLTNINGLCDIMVNMCKNALANHEFQKLIGYYLERSIKINNISFEVRNNKPILKNDIDSNITNVISEEKVRLFINAFNSLKEKYNDLTSSTFETDYESMQFTIYDISSDKTKEYVYQGKLFGLYNYIHGEIYKEGLELVKHKLQQKYSFNFWFL